MSSPLQNQKAVAQKFLEVEAAWDQDANVALRTDDCTYQLSPLRMEHPVRNNEEFKDFYNQFKPLWSNYKNEVLKAIHDAEEHTCALQIMNRADTPLGPFEVETIFFLSFTEDGKKIKATEEFVDSAYLTDFLGRAAELGKEQK